MYNIRPGDLMYLGTDNFKASHATIISKVDSKRGIIRYAAHSEARKYRNIANVIKEDHSMKVKIIVMY